MEGESTKTHTKNITSIYYKNDAVILLTYKYKPHKYSPLNCSLSMQYLCHTLSLRYFESFLKFPLLSGILLDIFPQLSGCYMYGG